MLLEKKEDGVILPLEEVREDGSVNVFYTGTCSMNASNVNVSGGTGGDTNSQYPPYGKGGSGGAGSVTFTRLQ